MEVGAAAVVLLLPLPLGLEEEKSEWCWWEMGWGCGCRVLWCWWISSSSRPSEDDTHSMLSKSIPQTQENKEKNIPKPTNRIQTSFLGFLFSNFPSLSLSFPYYMSRRRRERGRGSWFDRILRKAGTRQPLSHKEDVLFFLLPPSPSCEMRITKERET